MALPPFLAQKRQLHTQSSCIFSKFLKQYSSFGSPQSADASLHSSREIFATTRSKKKSVIMKMVLELRSKDDHDEHDVHDEAGATKIILCLASVNHSYGFVIPLTNTSQVMIEEFFYLFIYSFC